MTQREQKNFVQVLSDNIAREIIDDIDRGHIPPDWDGHELRCLLEDKHRSSASMSTIRRSPRSKAAREYKNTIITGNIKL